MTATPRRLAPHCSKPDQAGQRLLAAHMGNLTTRLAMPDTLEPLAISPAASGRFLGVSKRTIYNLISARKIIAKKDKGRTLVDVASIRAYYAALPEKDGPEPLFGDPEPKPKARPKAMRH
jgi:hypothetical protein